MKNFDWYSFKNNTIVVNCNTLEKAHDFLKECNSMGIKWDEGDSLLDYNKWNNYKEHTCYDCDNSDMYYNHIDHYEEMGCMVVEWECETKEKFTLNDIKPFYVIELMNNSFYLVCETQEGIILKDNDGFLYLNKYNKFNFNFKNRTYKEWDIKKIYGFSNNQKDCTKEDISTRSLLWERKEEIKEMSLEEIENILGYKVKIVSRETL